MAHLVLRHTLTCQLGLMRHELCIWKVLAVVRYVGFGLIMFGSVALRRVMYLICDTFHEVVRPEQAEKIS